MCFVFRLGGGQLVQFLSLHGVIWFLLFLCADGVMSLLPSGCHTDDNTHTHMHTHAQAHTNTHTDVYFFAVSVQTRFPRGNFPFFPSSAFEGQKRWICSSDV